MFEAAGCLNNQEDVAESRGSQKLVALSKYNSVKHSLSGA